MGAKTNVPVSVEFISKFEALEKDLKKLQNNVKKQGKQATETGSKFKSLGKDAVGAIKGMLSPAGLLTGAITGLIALTGKWLKTQKELSDETNNVNRTIERFTGNIENVEDSTNSIIRSISKVSGESFDEVTNSINTLSETFGTDFATAAEQYNQLIVKNVKDTGEINAQIQEYSTVLAGAGVKSQTFLNIIGKGLTAGIYDDKAIDFLKEVTISLSEMDDDTRAAIKSLKNSDEVFKAINAGNYNEAFNLIAEGLEDSGKSGSELYTFLQQIGKSLAEDIGVNKAMETLKTDTEAAGKAANLTAEQYNLLAERLLKVRDAGFFSDVEKSQRQLTRSINRTVSDIQKLTGDYLPALNEDPETAAAIVKKATERYKELMSVRSSIGDDAFNKSLSESSKSFLKQGYFIEAITAEYEKQNATIAAQADATKKAAQEKQKIESDALKAKQEAATEAQRIETEGADGTLKHAKYVLTQLNDEYNTAKTRIERNAIKVQIEFQQGQIDEMEQGVQVGDGTKLTGKAAETITGGATEESVGINTDGISNALTNAGTEVDDFMSKMEGVNDSVADFLDKNAGVINESFNLINQGVSTFSSMFENAKNRELKSAGDNARKKEAIEKKYFEKQKKLSIVQAVINGAVAFTQALASSPYPTNLVFAGLTAAMTAAQIATINGQSFATGGIVGGTSYKGDQVRANVNSGEMILNNGQQRRLFDIANGSSGGSSSGGNVRFEIDGDKLVGVLENHSTTVNSYS